MKKMLFGIKLESILMAKKEEEEEDVEELRFVFTFISHADTLTISVLKSKMQRKETG